MANLRNILYPPLIDTFMPAFLNTEPMKITFTISPYMTTFYDIKKIHISVIDQITNEKIFKTTSIPKNTNTDQNNFALIDGILILPINNKFYISTDSDLFIYEVSIPPTKTFLKTSSNTFQTDRYYKIQIRFDKNIEDLNKISTSYLTDGAMRNNFSEWSTVSLIKAISAPSLSFSQFMDVNEINPLRIQPGTIPFFGSVKFEDTAETETLQSFQAQIFSYQDDILIFSSEQIYTERNIDPNEINWYPDIEKLIESNKTYYAIFTCTTKNQYVFTSDPFYFKLADLPTQIILNLITKYKGRVENHYLLTEEDGTVEFNVSTPSNIGNNTQVEIPNGFLYIRRASSLDNFKNWDLISCTLEPLESGKIDRTFSDFTVGSLIKYKYSYQYRLADGTFLEKHDIKNENESIVIYPDFHDILISRGNRQLAIRYNPQITSFSSVVNRQKVNTLGGKYPKFIENANMNYKQFTISGLLTAEADFNRKFLDDLQYQKLIDDYDSVMDGRYIVRNDTIADGINTYQSQMNSSDAFYQRKRDTQKNTEHDLYPIDNWLWERIFREEALKWLNDGQPKLFRSMTEGNLAVILSDVTLTPNPQIGRRVYNISMTVTEVEDGYSLPTLESLGIVSIPNEYEDYRRNKKTFPETQMVSEKIGQMYQISSTQFDPDSKGLVSEILNPYYQSHYQGTVDYNSGSQGEMYFVLDGSYKIKSLKVQFESDPLPYFINGGGKLQKAEEGVNNTDNILFGYKLGLSFGTQGFADIFVNDRGYYQVPSEIEITEIKIYDDAQATFDFIISYEITKKDGTTVIQQEISEPEFVGQIYGTWFANESIYKKISEKYENTITIKEGSSEENNKRRIYESLGKILAINFDVEPYTIAHIVFEEPNELTPQDYLVGRTGVYNLMTEFPIKEVYFKGKRMFKVDFSNQPFLDEWEFVIDDHSYNNITEIQNPKYNTAYKINGAYKIYYIDQNWYNFSIKDNIIGVAEVPIYGIINYRGNLIRKQYK